MRINISYREPLTFEQFKEQFEQHFILSNPVKKEADMKKAWEKAEARLKPKQKAKTDTVIDEPVKVIEAELPLREDGSIATGIAESESAESPKRNRNR